MPFPHFPKFAPKGKHFPFPPSRTLPASSNPPKFQPAHPKPFGQVTANKCISTMPALSCTPTPLWSPPCNYPLHEDLKPFHPPRKPRLFIFCQGCRRRSRHPALRDLLPGPLPRHPPHARAGNGYRRPTSLTPSPDLPPNITPPTPSSTPCPPP